MVYTSWQSIIRQKTGVIFKSVVCPLPIVLPHGGRAVFVAIRFITSYTSFSRFNLSAWEHREQMSIEGRVTSQKTAKYAHRF